MATRNQRILFLSRLSAGLLLLVFVLLNVAAGRTVARLDLTRDGIYTLSDASRGVLRSLKDPVRIRVFWSNMPDERETQRLYVDALLREMRAAAGDRMTVRWVDLESEDGKAEAKEARVQPIQYQQQSEGEIRLAEGYSSLQIQMGDEDEVVDELAFNTDEFEYEVISRIYRMNRTDETVVGLVAPRPAMNPFAGAQSGRFNALETLLGRQFESSFRSHLTLDEPVPSDVDVLLVVAPEDLSEEQVYRIEQYLLGGGRVLLLLDPVKADLGEAPATEPTKSGLEEWLSHLGVTIEGGVVGDFASYLSRPRIVQSYRGRQLEFGPYPYWVLIHGSYLDNDNPAVRGFSQVPLYWPAPLSVDEAKQTAAGRTSSVLATTTERGYRRPDLIRLDHAEEDPVTVADLQPKLPLLVLLEGPFTSFWTGRPAPGEPEKAPEAPTVPEPSEPSEASGAPEAAPDPGGANEAPPSGEGEAAPVPPGPEGESPPPGESEGDGEEAGASEDPDEAPVAGEPSGPTRLDEGRGLLLVATDAELVGDDGYRLSRMTGLSAYVSGITFVQNLTEWMGGSDELLALRARSREGRVIEDVDADEQKLIKWANLVSVPLLALLAFVVVFIVRRVQS